MNYSLNIKRKIIYLISNKIHFFEIYFYKYKFTVMFKKILILIFIISSCQNENTNENNELNTLNGITEFKIDQKIDNNSVKRNVIIHAPEETIVNKNYPIVFFFHGNGGSAENGFILEDLVNNHQFIGVYPQGYRKSWNLGQEQSNADDVEFTDMIINELSKYSNLDINRKFAIGFSNGSAMVNELGIKRSYLKGIAPLASQLLESQIPNNSTNPLSVYQISGSKDDVIPFEGGLSVVGHRFMSAHKSVKSWAIAFNCNIIADINTINSDTLFSYKNCENDHQIIFRKSENGNHDLNGNHKMKYEKIWEYFKTIN
mgnify:CR=1 FL=1